jgi:hypothetical protein
MKTPPVGAELFHADGQTDTTKLIVVLRNFAKAPKNPVFDLFRFFGHCGRVRLFVTNLESDFFDVPLLCGTELDDYRAGILDRN